MGCQALGSFQGHQDTTVFLPNSALGPCITLSLVLVFPSNRDVSSVVELNWKHRLPRELSHLPHCIDTK